MMQRYIEQASWITAPARFQSPVFFTSFCWNGSDAVRIAVTALGFYELYLNGKRVGDAYFRPSGSVVRKRDLTALAYPIHDTLTYRCYYDVYDITNYLQQGENRLEIAVGGGFYRQFERVAEGDLSYGDALGVRFALVMGEDAVYSNEAVQCRDSATVYSNLFYGEHYDVGVAAAQSYHYAPVRVIELPETVLSKELAPPDRIIRRIKPRLLSDDGEKRIYDVGENITGLAAFTTACKAGECVVLRFAEVLAEGALSFHSTGSDHYSPSGMPQIQSDIFYGDGEVHRWHPCFVWHGFRYFEVVGDADDFEVLVMHADVPVTAEFDCDCEELNWLFNAYIRTQLGNMHLGYPSDCPHRERLGYTGDGQVCAPTAMLLLDAKDFYRKWMRDIFDSQDEVSGHVNHTAPFAGGGGGPGGWGMAAITVPYFYYRQYGDIAPVKAYYPRMKKWISYLQSRMANGLIVREEEGGWCLGDWCTLEKTEIPARYVNTCLYLRGLNMLIELALALGLPGDARCFRSLYLSSAAVIYRDYRDAKTHSFLGGMQGADAFAIAAGLGDEKTLAVLIGRYRALGHFDTGFIGTDLLCEILMENGEVDLAVELLCSHQPGGFGYMMEHGASTIWENWTGEESHNHPMFGACVRTLFTGILGIRQEKDSVGWAAHTVCSKLPKRLHRASGSILTPKGRIRVDLLQSER